MKYPFVYSFIYEVENKQKSSQQVLKLPPQLRAEKNNICMRFNHSYVVQNPNVGNDFCQVLEQDEVHKI